MHNITFQYVKEDITLIRKARKQTTAIIKCQFFEDPRKRLELLQEKTLAQLFPVTSFCLVKIAKNYRKSSIKPQGGLHKF